MSGQKTIEDARAGALALLDCLPPPSPGSPLGDVRCCRDALLCMKQHDADGGAARHKKLLAALQAQDTTPVRVWVRWIREVVRPSLEYTSDASHIEAHLVLFYFLGRAAKPNAPARTYDAWWLIALFEITIWARRPQTIVSKHTHRFFELSDVLNELSFY